MDSIKIKNKSHGTDWKHLGLYVLKHELVREKRKNISHVINRKHSECEFVSEASSQLLEVSTATIEK